MENLQNTITKTDTLKNDLKLAKQKINDKILSGGGTIANTLNAVPNAIDKMLKDNYKKVAIINISSFFVCSNYIAGSSPFSIELPINLGFTPTRILVFINGVKHSKAEVNKKLICGMDSDEPTREGEPRANDRLGLILLIESFDRKNLTLKVKGGSSMQDVYLDGIDIIAIE